MGRQTLCLFVSSFPLLLSCTIFCLCPRVHLDPRGSSAVFNPSRPRTPCFGVQPFLSLPHLTRSHKMNSSHLELLLALMWHSMAVQREEESWAVRFYCVAQSSSSFPSASSSQWPTYLCAPRLPVSHFLLLCILITALFPFAVFFSYLCLTLAAPNFTNIPCYFIVSLIKSAL